MANYSHEDLGVQFSVPDKVTVREQVRYRSMLGLTANAEWYERAWLAGLTVIKDWRCDRLPDPQQFDLDAASDPILADIVIFAGGRVSVHMAELRNVPLDSLPPSSSASTTADPPPLT